MMNMYYNMIICIIYTKLCIESDKINILLVLLIIGMCPKHSHHRAFDPSIESALFSRMFSFWGYYHEEPNQEKYN